jgi:hypothetical protein
MTWSKLYHKVFVTNFHVLSLFFFTHQNSNDFQLPKTLRALVLNNIALKKIIENEIEVIFQTKVNSRPLV